MKKTILVCLYLLAWHCCLSQQQSGDGKNSPNPFEDFAFGDPQRCLLKSRANNLPVNRFEVLPGSGWDNIQNKAKAQVVAINYTKCTTTNDGRYLIPDNVFSIPIKESKVQRFAEIISNWNEATSTTSNSINVQGGYPGLVHSVSGSFSWERSQIRKRQMENNATTTRVQLRYHRYMTKLQPGAKLHPAFKRRLFSIAAHLTQEQAQMADYEAQLIVRDFGTHVQTSVVAGAALIKTDFLKRDFKATGFKDKTDVVVGASYSYAQVFQISASIGHSSSEDNQESYSKSLKYSYVTTLGGPLMKMMNMTANDWADGIDLDLVPLDVSGDPLSFLVTQDTLPDLPADLVNQVELTLRKAIVLYYEMNTISGCTIRDSPNYSFSANFDDGTCGKTVTNTSFGGVYQTCRVEGEYLNNNPCDNLAQVNPKTSNNSCPASFQAVELITGRRTEEETKIDCTFYFFLGDLCETTRYRSTAVYTTYWCAGTGDISRDSGYLFGGIYSKSHDNPLTGSMGCPPSFYPRIFLDQQICISEDFEVGTPHSVPFGGFMSCTKGNPLALSKLKPSAKAQKKGSQSDSLFMSASKDQRMWPSHCPQGFSQHLLAIVNSCEVRYCLKSGTFSKERIPKAQLPPFMNKPQTHVEDDNRFIFDPEVKQWIDSQRSYAGANENQQLSQMTWKQLWEMKGAPRPRGFYGNGGEKPLTTTYIAGVVLWLAVQFAQHF